MIKVCFVFVTVLFLTSRAAAQKHDHEKESKESQGEIRIYLADKDKKPVDLKNVKATVLLEPAGGAKRNLNTKLISPKGEMGKPIGHSGEVREAEGYVVEFVVQKPHGEHHEDHPGKHEKHDDEAAKGHDHADGTPYFAAALDLNGYTCGMEGHPIVLKGEKCPKCTMAMKPVALKFSAVVVFRIGDKSFNVKGFEYPAAIPNNYKDAVAKIEGHLKSIEGLVESKDLEKVHAVAEKISQIAEKLPSLAQAEAKVEVEKTCKSIVALFNEIDEAADAGKKEDTLRAVKKYKSGVAELKKHLKEEHHK